MSGLIKELFHKEEEEASLSVYAAVQQIRTVLEENTYYNKYLSEEDKKEKILENQKIIRSLIGINFMKKNDIEIGKVKSNGKIEYYEGESKEKYTKSKEKDEYGKTKGYEIKKADKEYLKINKKARKGYVYASLETPDIDYYTLTSEDDVTIAGVPTLLRVKNN